MHFARLRNKVVGSITTISSTQLEMKIRTEKTRLKVAEKLDSLGVDYTFAFSRIVRRTGPNWYQTVLDIMLIRCRTSFYS